MDPFAFYRGVSPVDEDKNTAIMKSYISTTTVGVLPKPLPGASVVMSNHLETASNGVQVKYGIIGVPISIVVNPHVSGDAFER